MADSSVKEGLSEKKGIEGVGTDHKRHGPNQVPKRATETAKKGGKSFKIK